MGAGKTTFINKLLKKYSSIKFALVENEFGAVGIDTKLIKGVDASQMFELKNGCICCSISDEFEQVLFELAERFPNVEQLLIETTGIADPVTIIQPFLNDKTLKTLYHYNGTICLLDLLNFESQPQHDISVKQLMVADIVLLNKYDRGKNQAYDTVSATVKELNPLCKIIPSLYGNVESIDLFDIQNITFYFPLLKDKNRSGEAHVLKSKALIIPEPLNKQQFLDWIDYTVDIYKNQIFRYKGLLYFKDEPFEYILNGVGGSFTIEEGDLIHAKENSRIVFIGQLQSVELLYPTQDNNPQWENNH